MAFLEVFHHNLKIKTFVPSTITISAIVAIVYGLALGQMVHRISNKMRCLTSQQEHTAETAPISGVMQHKIPSVITRITASVTPTSIIILFMEELRHSMDHIITIHRILKAMVMGQTQGITITIMTMAAEVVHMVAIMMAVVETTITITEMIVGVEMVVVGMIGVGNKIVETGIGSRIMYRPINSVHI